LLLEDALTAIAEHQAEIAPLLANVVVKDNVHLEKEWSRLTVTNEINTEDLGLRDFNAWNLSALSPKSSEEITNAPSLESLSYLDFRNVWEWLKTVVHLSPREQDRLFQLRGAYDKWFGSDFPARLWRCPAGTWVTK
jgi:hypothetical protein